jgi:hypothetical protein
MNSLSLIDTCKRALLASLLPMTLLLAPSFARADSAVWALDGDSNGITIYTRKQPGNLYKDFKGVMQIDAPMKQVVGTLADVRTMHEWFFLLHEARFIQGQADGDTYIYMALDGIWPVSARDVVAHITVRQDPATYVIHVDVDSRDGILPPQPGHVRMPRMTSSWTLRPISPTKTAIELEGHGDPGGWIPLSFANMVIATVPRQTMEKMRSYVMKANYTDPEKLYAQSPPLRELGKRLVFPDS